MYKVNVGSVVGIPPRVAPEDFVQLTHNRQQWGVAAQQQQKPVPVPIVQKAKSPIVPVTVGCVPIAVTPVGPFAGSPGQGIEDELTTQNLYKTELCRSFEETGICRYGNKCQFAHGASELRPVMRHPKYKTEVCKTFHTIGTCPYGKRCRFIHIAPGMPLPSSSSFATPALRTEWSTSWNQDSSKDKVFSKPVKPFKPVYAAPAVEQSTPLPLPLPLPLEQPQQLQKQPVQIEVTPQPEATPQPTPTPSEDEDGIARRLDIFAKICSN